MCQESQPGPKGSQSCFPVGKQNTNLRKRPSLFSWSPEILKIMKKLYVIHSLPHRLANSNVHWDQAGGMYE